jgi:squalene-hopene/tetraprenyl-beta-curcumene cyclase
MLKSMMRINNTIEQTIANTQSHLLEQRHAGGFWTGRLSSSALATATAVFALGSVNRRTYHNLIEGGLHWLKDNQNADGGWGDTIKSHSNLTTTLLSLSAFSVSDGSFTYNKAIAKAEAWIEHHVGSRDPKAVALAVDKACAHDKHASTPVLMMCAMARRLGPRNTRWQHVKPLPFERAALPKQLVKWLRLPRASHTLPVLIAVGQARFQAKKPSCPVRRRLRQACISKTLNILKTLQLSNGSFLKAAPTTSFVIMGLARSGMMNHRVVTKGAYFLVDSVRDDGSWPIDTNLATRITSLSVGALTTESPDMAETLANTRDWLLTLQHTQANVYTDAASGAWACGDLSAAVPDGDTTAGALIALHRLSPAATRSQSAATQGIQWLLNLQNKDGGMPAFGKGWKTPGRDASCPDITAHALGAMGCWMDSLPKRLRKRTTRAMQQAVIYLKSTQHEQGFWTPSSLGHEQTDHQTNPVYGTSRVMTHLADLPQAFKACMNAELIRAAEWLMAVQHPSGPWGGDMATHCSLEESALAVDALATSLISHDLLLFDDQAMAIESAVNRGALWLAKATKTGTTFDPSPIGLYFARLWYTEALYPVTFTLSALKKAKFLLKLHTSLQAQQTTKVVALPPQPGRKGNTSKPSDVMAL